MSVIRHAFRATLLLALILALVSPVCGPVGAAVGHVSSGATLAKLVTKAPASKAPLGNAPAGRTAPGSAGAAGPAGRPGFLENVRGQAAGWTGGILAMEGLRSLAAPVTSAIASGLSKVLPGGAAGAVGRIATELISGAAFKVGMDAGGDLLRDGTIKKPDWLEVGAAAAGMVIGGQLLRPFFGPIGEAIGSWVGWSLAESLVRQYRAGKALNLLDALKDIDVPRLAIQAVTAEGAALVARPLAQRLLGGILPMGGPLGIVAGIGVQIALTAVASTLANRIGDSLFGEKDGDEGAGGGDLASLQSASREAYERFLKASRRSGGGDTATAEALADYRRAQARVEAARAR